MSIFHNNILAGSSGQGGSGYQIERSLRLNKDDSAYLNFTPSSDGNRKTWTWSAWFKRSRLTINDYSILFGAIFQNLSDYSFLTYGHSADSLMFYDSGAPVIQMTDVFRDSSAWTHICLAVDKTQSTASNAFRLYKNNELADITYSGTYTQNEPTAINRGAVPHSIGSNLPYSGRYFDGYIAETYFIDGQALAPSDFGEYDDNNVWQPIEYAGTYGANGWHLDFSDNTSTTTIAEDSSGNGNDWTANNISVTAGAGNDSLLDSPTNGTQTDTGLGGEVSGNYSTWNPLSATQADALSEGCLTVTKTSGGYESTTSSIAVKQGKWYAEFKLTLAGSYPGFGITEVTSQVASNPSYSAYIGAEAKSYNYYPSLGWYSASTQQPTYNGTTISTGDIIGLALDLDSATKTLKTYINGSLDNTLNVADPDLGYVFGTTALSAGSVITANFGQRAFTYAAPSGYKCLCTANLPDPTIADGSQYFDTKLYTGNGSTQTVSGLNFSPDFVWIKNRPQNDNHKLLDTVRGATKEIESNTTDAEVTNADGLTAFNSDGFALGADNEYNTSSEAYVAWNWDAGSSTVSNTDGTITSQVRANPSAGFSIVSYTGTGANATFGHGLNTPVEMVIIKHRTGANFWVVGHKDLPFTSDKYLMLDASSASLTAGGVAWQSTAPTSSVVSIGTSSVLNGSGNTHIAYCFAPVEGYSAFGSYTGNGSVDGPFVYTGFNPRWIMIKSTASTNSWVVHDTARDPHNAATRQLLPNLSSAEFSTTATSRDFLSNGFKLRNTNASINTLNIKYIYAAFAEHPFKTARAR